MRISLVHNPTAGGGHDADDVVALLTEAGHEVRYRSSEDDWSTLLQDPGDLVVGAGGDGTIRAVALAAADHGVPFAVLPLGTANNIGKSLGLVGEARELVRGWSTGSPWHQFDIGVVTGPHGEHRFVESAGAGPMADLIALGPRIGADARLLGRETDRALHLLSGIVREARPRAWQILADGEDLSGEYLAVEVMNVRFVGPNVPLAPAADPSDGWLDLVVVREADRRPLVDYLERRLHLASGVAPDLGPRPVRETRLVVPDGVRLHVDDRLWPADGPADHPVELVVTCAAGAARVVGAR